MYGYVYVYSDEPQTPTLQNYLVTTTKAATTTKATTGDIFHSMHLCFYECYMHTFTYLHKCMHAWTYIYLHSDEPQTLADESGAT